MNRTKVSAICRKVWGEGSLQTVNGGWQWYARSTGRAHWLGYSLSDAYRYAAEEHKRQ